MCPPPGLHKFPKEAQRLLQSLLLPSLPAVAQQGLPGHVLLSVFSLPALPSLLPGPITRFPVQERFLKRKRKKATHPSVPPYSLSTLAASNHQRKQTLVKAVSHSLSFSLSSFLPPKVHCGESLSSLKPLAPAILPVPDSSLIQCCRSEFWFWRTRPSRLPRWGDVGMGQFRGLDLGLGGG